MGNTTYRLGATEIVEISGVSAASNLEGASQKFRAIGHSVVRIQSDVDCFILIGSEPVATISNGFPVSAGVYEYVDIPPGQKIAAITAGDSGKLYLTIASKP